MCQNFASHGSCLFHQPLKKLEHCGICPQSRPRRHLHQVYFARYCLTFSKSCRAQKNRVDIAELLPQLSCPPDSPQNALRTLLGLEDASKSKPKFFSPMFKDHGRPVYACHRNHREWLQPNKMLGSYLRVPTKPKLSCPDSFRQFGLMSLSPKAHRCVVGFRASLMSTVSSRSQHLFL